MRLPLLADQHDLAVAQVDAHISYVPIAALSTAAVAGLIAFSVRPIVGGPRVALWLGLLVLPMLWRLWLRSRLRKDANAMPADAARRQFRGAFALNGAVWGAASVLVFPDTDLTMQALLVFVVVGVTASSLTAAAFDLTAGLLFGFATVVPLSMRVFAEGSSVAASLGAMLALFLGFMTAHAVRVHRRYAEAFRLRRASALRAEAMATLQAAFGRLQQIDVGDSVELVGIAAKEAAEALHAYRVLVCRFDRTSGQLVVVAMAGPGAGRPATPPTTLASICLYENALASTGRLDFGLPAVDALRSALAGSALEPSPGTIRLDVPLRIGGRIDGVFCCERFGVEWTDDEATFVTATAATVLAATEEARRRDAESDLRELNQDLERRIDERTRALSASEARLAQALDVTNDGLWDFNLSTGAVYFSPVWARLLGFAPHEVPARAESFWELVHPEDVSRVQAVLADHIAGRRPTKDLEIRLRTKQGEYRWFRDQGRIVEQNADGTPRRMLGTISDITERRRVLDALHESEARFRALFDKSPVIFTLVDMAESRIVEMNEVGLRMFGYTREEAVGKTTLELDMWVDELERRRAARRLIDQGFVSGIELQLRRKNGETFWALLSSTVVTLQGRPYALSTLQDMTERRELEARVLQAQKMEIVGHLAGGIAHDFNNVLTVVSSMAEIGIDDSRPGDPAREALETIHQASTRASGLTRQLLAFSRRQVLRPTTVNLDEALAALVPIVRRAVGESVGVEFLTSAASSTVVVDRGSLDQVVLNLAINARDAMPDGGTLTMSVDATSIDDPGRVGTLPPGRYVTLTIRDTGTGMTDDTRRRAFEPFFTTKDVGKGTGLGLSVAHGIVAQSGGEIVVESVLGVGTTFTIFLPAATGRTEAPAIEQRQVWTGSERVLVVDDDPDIRRVLGRALGHAGYDILSAGNGVEALSVLAAETGKVDLLLTDVMMPGMGGSELAARVREDYPTVRILFTSGYAENAIAKHGVLADDAEFIAKPYTLHALTRKVRGVLDR